MTGIADVAALAGVSKATASRALSGSGYVSSAARERVLDAVDRLGYVPASNAVGLATGRTRAVGVIIPYVHRWFFAAVLEGIQQVFLDSGDDLLLYNAMPGSVGRALIFDDFLARKRFDGLVAVGLEPDDAELARLGALERPVVSVVGEAGPDVIAIDDVAAVTIAFEHLRALGHERIAFLGGGDPSRHWARVDRRRLEAFQALMRDAGLESAARHVPSAVDVAGGFAAATRLLTAPGPRPTAIIGTCDEVAIGAALAARGLGLSVPGDVSLVGIDDHELAVTFGLTTVKQSPFEQGARAARVMLERIAGRESLIEGPAECGLVLRTSTGPA
ncbi:LacI family transcriptional regulator [Pseudoclavibacter chungangensis]|uniref:LacI family transcriptional regulator n=1 Tax=Pseudoclavibacter chungangensis TaxID=587635 RepID=A0A7J5C1Y1_9MICO|nr:LacI family DNA-binding transcriptional regulator [Pseudoclavibacter chungangensis]KAB1662170.1 LacI family transcriptional regulator [Pseudoclavibacter chungangensis]NYJ65357.1 DNA-binding LacI/PurR family transcriptional regulator [Pseudoclavibacter chungangensis]